MSRETRYKLVLWALFCLVPMAVIAVVACLLGIWQLAYLAIIPACFWIPAAQVYVNWRWRRV